MNFKQLEYFVHVAELGGFSKAAVVLDIAQSALSPWPLIVPERGHAIRKLLETQAVLSGIKLNIAWEVSSIAAILDLVCAGYGHAVLHAVLHASAVAASDRADLLRVRPLVQPRLNSVLCLAVSAQAP